MTRFARALQVVGMVAAICSPAFGAIVYSGSQDVTLSLGPMSPMASKTIQLGGMADDWDDFRVELWLDMGMPGHPPDPCLDGMGMGACLAIYAPRGMGMSMGGILGMGGKASMLGMGASIGADSFFDIFVEIDGFGEDGGYIGLRTGMGQYGWLHMLRQSNMGTDTHSVTFDGWAYEEQPGVSVAAGEGGPCDWKPGSPHKMHWPQLPDLSVTGMDVSLAKAVLADDFKCTATGPIRDIHFWGSFVDDVLPKDGPGALTLELRIYSDVPATTTAWSRPGELLWRQVFHPGQYEVRRVHNGPEDWYDPVAGQYLPDNHRYAFQYDFCIVKDPFVQEAGKIYWLAIEDLSDGDKYTFGWKTTTLRYRFNDDAVYLDAANADWVEMVYPKGHKYERESVDLAFVITNGQEVVAEKDLGDAPDSSNSVNLAMTAYPGVTAHFPTVHQAGSPPYGPIHHHPRDLYYLGKWVSLENEADVGPDEDPVTNIDSVGDLADRDGGDDGLQLPVVMPFCERTRLEYTVTVTHHVATEAYVNVWCDWNRDGDWDDLMTCADGDVVPEWAVQNDKPTFSGVGVYTFTTSPFKCWHPAKDKIDPIWVRITIADQEHLPSILFPGTAPGIEGAGPKDGYKFGETEDYYLRPLTEPAPVKYDWGDAPETAAAAGYPTLAASDGARHIPVGPWLGDEKDRPDSEADGQPHVNALGDNIGGSDDENGVSIPPLTQGAPASATIRVSGGGGIVQAWIDFNGDRAWQPAEKIFDGFLPDGPHVLPFSVPNAAIAGQTFARFRISRQGGLTPIGAAPDGEVEDHEVWIDAPAHDGKLWCQPPDLTPQGIDIRVDRSDGKPRTLADDFGCSSAGKLLNVRLWGSWKNDRKGEIKRIRLRIHPDDPVGPDGADKKNKYSKPGPETLWEKEFLAGQFQELLYHVVHIDGEWWWDPVTGEALPGGDTQVWQIDMDINPDEAFVQEGSSDKPMIYWLAVETETAEGQFGWKTRHWPDHFADDAVWDAGSAGAWRELHYPAGHPYHEKERNSIDLAFCLMFSSEGPQVTSQAAAVTQCPPVATTCPALLTVCPTLETQCPTAATKCPPVQTQCPPAVTLCQAAPTACPMPVTTCPPQVTQCEAVETRCPVVETKCPPVQTQCPPILTKCPPFDTRCPPIETKCPPVETECPPVETKCPPIETKCPPIETKCPPLGTQCPPEPTKCPPTPTECHVVQTQCPIVETRCPITETKCPPMQTQCPQMETRCPPLPTACPVAYTQCPPTVTECTSELTKCPVTPTRCPLELTKCPATVTECVQVETQCPTVKTKCPPSDTQCPVVQTQCPPVFTRCPATTTICTPTHCMQSTANGEPTGGNSLQPMSACPIVETDCPSIDVYLTVSAAR